MTTDDGNSFDTKVPRDLTPDPPTSSTVHEVTVDVSSINEKALMRRIDLHVLPWLSVLYLFSFLDRGSIGNAKVRCLPTSQSSDFDLLC